MKILLTGGCGYIGSHTCCELINSGFDVVIVDNLENSEKDVIEKIRRITGKDVTFYEANLINKDLLRNVFIENDISAVIHFAGSKNSSKSIDSPLIFYRNNLDSTLSLLEVMKEFDCKKIIFSCCNIFRQTKSAFFAIFFMLCILVFLISTKSPPVYIQPFYPSLLGLLFP